jgi:hypothetical protein
MASFSPASMHFFVSLSVTISTKKSQLFVKWISKADAMLKIKVYYMLLAR